MGRTEERYHTMEIDIPGCRLRGSTVFGHAFLPSHGAADQPKTLKIGALISLTGWLLSLDVQMANELLLVQDAINEKGGITVKGQKYKIEVVIEDCKSTLDGVTARGDKPGSQGHQVHGRRGFFREGVRAHNQPESYAGRLGL